MTISSDFRREMFGQDSDDGPLVLITISHESLADEDYIRVALNTEAITSRSKVFQPYPFKYIRPERSGDRMPRTKLSIDNVDRRIIEAIRLVSTPMQVLIETVSFGDYDTVEESMDGFNLVNVQATFATVEGELSLEDLLAEPYPAGRFTPANHRGGF